MLVQIMKEANALEALLLTDTESKTGHLIAIP